MGWLEAGPEPLPRRPEERTSTRKREWLFRKFLQPFERTDLSAPKKFKSNKGLPFRPIFIEAFAQQSSTIPPLAPQPALS